MIKEHQKAKKNRAQIRFHEFKLIYKKNSNIIFAFCEGKDDISFYRGPIEECLKDNWSIQIWELGGVKNVLKLFKKFDWRRFNKHQVLFFIDRDLSSFTKIPLPKKLNIYITDGYSIENSIVTKNTCERIISELFKFHDLSYKNKLYIQNAFERELSKFTIALIPIMIQIIYWKKKQTKACLDQIEMKHFFSLNKCSLQLKNTQNIHKHIHSQCDIPFEENPKRLREEARLHSQSELNMYIRGKYLLWYLVEFCLSFHRDCKQISMPHKLLSQPKKVVNFAHSNAVPLISSRYRCPGSLKDFLKKTIVEYIS